MADSFDMIIRAYGEDLASGPIKKVATAVQSLHDKISMAQQKLASFNTKQEQIAKDTAFIDSLKKSNIELNKAGQFIDSTTKQFVSFDAVNSSLERVKNNTKQATANFNTLKNFFTSFRGELLGIGFLFGSIGAVLTGLSKQALNVFGTLGSVLTKGRLAFLELQAEIKNLLFQFAESESMQQFLNMLTSILQKVDELTPSQKDLVFSLILWGGAIATAISALAFFLLGLTAIGNALFQWHSVLAATIPFLTELGTAITAALGLPILAIIAILAVLAIAIWTNFAGIRDTIIEIFSAIFNYILAVINNIIELFSGVLDIITGIFEGDGDKVVGGFIKILRAILKSVLDFFALMVKINIEMMFFIGRVIADGAINIAKILFDIIPPAFAKVAEIAFNIMGGLAVKIIELFQFPLQAIIGIIKQMASALGDTALAEKMDSISQSLTNAAEGTGKSISKLGEDLGAISISGGEEAVAFLDDIKTKVDSTSDALKTDLLKNLGFDETGGQTIFDRINETINKLLPVQDDLNKKTETTVDLFAELNKMISGVADTQETISTLGPTPFNIDTTGLTTLTNNGANSIVTTTPTTTAGAQNVTINMETINELKDAKLSIDSDLEELVDKMVELKNQKNINALINAGVI